MKAVIENGGIMYDGPVIFLNKEIQWKLIIFNMYLNIIERCTSADELKKECSIIEFNLNYWFKFKLKKIEHKNPFTSGFTKDGFGVYLDGVRKIFVECETDIEE
jgi:hypothetical protein